MPGSARGLPTVKKTPSRAGSVVLWVVATVVVVGLAVWQQRTDPTRPRQGEVDAAGQSLTYTLLRKGGAGEPHRVTISAPDELSGNIRWRPFPGEEAFESLTMLRDAEELVGFLPARPAGSRFMFLPF